MIPVGTIDRLTAIASQMSPDVATALRNAVDVLQSLGERHAELQAVSNGYAMKLGGLERDFEDMKERARQLSLEVDRLRESKDNAYRERNRLVRVLAAIFPAGIRDTNIEGWDPEWHGCVYVDTSRGQMSWHYHDSERSLFADLEPYEHAWDGHTTEQKYERLQYLVHDIELTGVEALFPVDMPFDRQEEPS